MCSHCSRTVPTRSQTSEGGEPTRPGSSRCGCVLRHTWNLKRGFAFRCDVCGTDREGRSAAPGRKDLSHVRAPVSRRDRDLPADWKRSCYGSPQGQSSDTDIAELLGFVDESIVGGDLCSQASNLSGLIILELFLLFFN
jgi:hypothetical protein